MPGLGTSVVLLGAPSGVAVRLPIDAAATDTFGVTAQPAIVRAVITTLAETIGLADTRSATIALLVIDRLGLADPSAPNLLFRKELADLAAFAEVVRQAAPALLADEVGVAPTIAAQQAVTIVERLGLLPALQGAALYSRSVADIVRLADSIGQFFGADLEDTVATSETLTVNKMLAQLLTDTVAVAPVLLPQLMARVVTTEGIEITGEEVLQMFWGAAVSDAVEITAGYVAPDGNFTAWAMNTRNAAVTEYDNFEFNSFGVIAGRSVGATSEGLYELTGDDDAGDAIIARIKSGFMQFGGTKLSRLKAAYLATRGDAEFVLRIETGQGELYNYAVSTRGMRSTKVHMGKGQRARYFSFELISTGDDFDIDTLEFVPIVMARRV